MTGVGVMPALERLDGAGLTDAMVAIPVLWVTCAGCAADRAAFA